MKDNLQLPSYLQIKLTRLRVVELIPTATVSSGLLDIT